MRKVGLVVSRVIIALFFVVQTLFVYSQSVGYSSLNDGGWANTTARWALNSGSACGCAPPFVSNNTNVNIYHSIQSSSNMSLLMSDTLWIHKDGLLDSPGNSLSIENGVLIIQGELNIERLDISASGKVLMNGGKLNVINGNLENIGVLETDGYSNITIQNGNFNNLAGGSIDMNLTYLELLNGNVNNFGNMVLESVCSEAHNGNTFNWSSGVILGSATFSASGNIENSNTWGNDIQWCAEGNGVNMPGSENCGVHCVGALPVEFVKFEGRCLENRIVELQWKTTLEDMNVGFEVEKSVDGHNFHKIGFVPANSNISI